MQVVVPEQVSVELLAIVTLQSDPPVHWMLLSGPASRLQVDPPAQLETQFAVQVWLHVDVPAHCVVQPLPHATVHVLLLAQE